MIALHGLCEEERRLMRQALIAPMVEKDPIRLGLCMRLCGLGLLQRAGATAAANGWRGSPQAFCLTREGWRLVTAQRAQQPIRRAV